MLAATKKTALFELHQQLNARMAIFADWAMPVSYTSVMNEHRHVRTKAGIFDVSHMGEIEITGDQSKEFLQYLTTNDVRRLRPGQGQYTTMCNEHGGIIDDLILYNLTENRFLMCINASNCKKDFLWIQEHKKNFPDVSISDCSANWAQLAIQGPDSLSALEQILSDDNMRILQKLPYTGIHEIRHAGSTSMIARTGYTGEYGFEWYLTNDQVTSVWTALLEKKEHTNLIPVGLGARDTLRLEAGYLLYGQDMNESVTPLEAGIGWTVRPESGYFIGRDAIIRQKEGGVSRKIFAFKMSEPGIPRSGMEIYCNEEKIGHVTSGSALPTIGGAGGLAMIQSSGLTIGSRIDIDIRGKKKSAFIEKKPLYHGRIH